jgi:hypothetical protein
MEDNPADGRPNTRATNVSQHPGLVDKTKRRRRTKAEMERDRKIKQAEAEALKQKKDTNIRQVARLEDKMAIDDANAEKSHPRSRDGPHFFLLEHH